MRDPRPISVVVPTRDRAALLEECLVSLRSSIRDRDEIIVVDSASSDPLVREVASAHGASYVRCDVAGASLARNRGWRYASHDVIAFVDDDVRVDEGWADAVARVFSDPGTAFITGRIGSPPPSPKGRTVSGPPLAQKLETESARLDASTPGVLGHSANLAVRRSALESIGGFDEQLGAGARFRAAEDLDLFDRLFGAGYVGTYDPAASAVHEPWRRIRDYVRLQGSYGLGTGARIAKLLRADRRRALGALRSAFLRSGLILLVRAIRQRRWSEVAARLLRIAATAAGLLAALVVPVRDGHLGGRTFYGA